MAYTNQGSGIILCPDGEDYSMISDDGFAYLVDQMDNQYAHLEIISPEVFAMWFSNIRRLRIDYTLTEDGAPYDDGSEEISQWKLDEETGEPYDPNDDDHPNPKNILDGSELDVLSGPLSDYFLDDGTPGVLPFAFPPGLFRHRGEFYIYIDNLYSASPSFSINTAAMVITYALIDDFVATYTYTILDQFYTV